MLAPSEVIVTASTRNCQRIVHWVAPSALRTPISRVRSVTEIIMIAMTPIPPTISAIDEITINQGISTEKAKEIVKTIKDMKVKAQAAVQGDQVRVSSKSRDTLQDVMAALKEKDFGIPLQFTNYR